MNSGSPHQPILDAVTTAVAWLDKANGRSEQELTLRVLKLAEETGEAVAAWIGVVGQNPRKGVTHTREDVAAELCDVVQTALVAMASFNFPATSDMLAEAIEWSAEIEPAGGPTNELLRVQREVGYLADKRLQGIGGLRLDGQFRSVLIATFAAMRAFGVDPFATLTAKARAISARIAEMEAAR